MLHSQENYQFSQGNLSVIYYIIFGLEIHISTALSNVSPKPILVGIFRTSIKADEWYRAIPINLQNLFVPWTHRHCRFRFGAYILSVPTILIYVLETLIKQ